MGAARGLPLDAPSSAPSARLQIAVNLSARQFNDPQLPQMVARVLQARPACRRALLELEITESTAMQQTDAALRTLKQAEGSSACRIAIDDFGTGYSSLAYLQPLPGRQGEDRPQLRRRACPTTATRAPSSRRSSRSPTRCRSQVVAEGVETEAQREFLRVAAAATSSRATSSAGRADADSAAKEYV